MNQAGKWAATVMAGTMGVNGGCQKPKTDESSQAVVTNAPARDPVKDIRTLIESMQKVQRWLELTYQMNEETKIEPDGIVFEMSRYRMSPEQKQEVLTKWKLKELPKLDALKEAVSAVNGNLQQGVFTAQDAEILLGIWKHVEKFNSSLHSPDCPKGLNRVRSERLIDFEKEIIERRYGDAYMAAKQASELAQRIHPNAKAAPLRPRSLEL